MKIAIFGATGRTGRVTLGLALEQGHFWGSWVGFLGFLTAFLGCFRFRGDRAGPGFEVSVLVRDPSRLPPRPLRPPGWSWGDARDPRAVGEALRGQEGALVLLGTGSDLGPTTVMSEDKTILEAMAEHGVRKVVACLSAFLFWDPERVPERLRAVTEDHRRMERLLRDSGLPAVLVMPPHIAVDRPLTGDYEVAVGAAGGPGLLPGDLGADLGHFLLRCLRTDEFDGKSVYVSRHYPKE
ncbi:LOW QUALITY PROTEIN: flavin reductase (NADPH) [Ammospiza maritima maritima]